MKTVSVGIPVYNEAKTIAAVLRFVSEQKGRFKLENIFVICDGSKDNTAKIAESIAKQDKKIVVVSHKKNEGKAVRLNEIFKLNKSDYIIIFDGDITIRDPHLIEKVVSRFSSDNIGLVSSNNQPLSGNTLTGRVTKAAEDLWYETRKDVNRGDNYYNNSGCGVAFEKEFSKKISLPKGLIGDQSYIYFLCKKMNREFVFAKDAIVYYMPPQNVGDAIRQYRRSVREDEATIFSSEKTAVVISKLDKIKGLLICLVKNPFYTLLAVLGLTTLKHLTLRQDPLTKKGSWIRIDSSKQVQI